ncbi:MarR family winged helix-turn-helix transcriptional regulator [Sphingobium aromaticiconvertens]|uniref:MarR family winged helix-turn-helix transcriptional regulator n=1 Tax=Sphingobium aromaticiconvertens TaxID=365341 RepID=UPI0030160DC6
MESDLSNLTLRALRRILRATEIGSRKLATSTGLTPSQLLVLREINGRDHATPSAIAAALKFSQATITAVVDRLVASALVTRERSDRDKRQFILSTTDNGREALDCAPDMLQSQFTEHFSALAAWEQAMILTSLEKLSLILGAQDMDVAPLLDSGAIDRSEPG